MKLIRTEEARAGQKAAKDVTDLRGNVLFKAGTELTPDVLKNCRQRNISHLFVEDDEGVAQPADQALQRQTIEKQVDAMFAGVDDYPPMAALREAAKRYLIARSE